MIRTLILVVITLVLAVALGRWLSTDTGVVVIGLREHVIRMSLATAAVGVQLGGVALTLLTSLVWRMVTVRARWQRWRALRRTRRNQHSLHAGLLTLAAGDYPRAERLLARARGAEVPAAHYLAAAQAAHAQGATTRRDDYLALARDAAPPHLTAVLAQQVELQLADGNTGGATATLRELEALAPTQPATLRLRHRGLVAAGAWDAIPALLPELKRHRAYSAERLTELEAESAAHTLAKSYATRAALEASWNTLPKATRALPVVTAAYAQQLRRLDASSQAEVVLRKALTRQWDGRLIAAYGELHLPIPAEAVRHAEGWLTEHPDDPGLLLALGRLCLAAQLWGKARAYLETVLAAQPSALIYRLLAEVYERLNEPSSAARQRQLGLDLATGMPTALPAP